MASVSREEVALIESTTRRNYSHMNTSILSTSIRGLAARRLLLPVLLQGALLLSSIQAAPLQLEPADSPVDNPMKGLVPYAGNSPTCWVI